MHKVALLATELHGTSKRLNKIIDNPKFRSDLKETAQKVEATAERIQKTMQQVNDMLADQGLRTDVLSALAQLNQSTEHVENAVKSIETLGKDKDIRTDTKEILGKANETVDKVNQLVSQPSFGTDLKHTLATTRNAIEDVDTVARQLQNILDKRHPLLHMIFGRPGAKTAEKENSEIR